MRKIFQSAPDLPQGVANKAIEIIERHFSANGVRRASELPEEAKVRLLRDLQAFFALEVSWARQDKGNVTQTSRFSALLTLIKRAFRIGTRGTQSW